MEGISAAIDGAAKIRQMAEAAPVHRPEPVEGPIPLFPSLADPEPYPVEALGPVLAPAAKAIARKVQVPDAMAGQSVLAVAALAAQALADIKMPYGQTRPLSLYCVTAAGSGDRKSTADNEALWPVKKHEQNLKEKFEADLNLWHVDHSAWASERKKIEADKALNLDSRKTELLALGPEPRKPTYPSLTATDPTHEGLLKAWPGSYPALGIFSSEGGQFFSGTGMAHESRLRTAAGFSERWDGSPAKRVRAGDGLTLLYGRRLSMHLLAQREATGQFMADPVLLDQGLLSRILIAAPPSRAGARPYTAPRPDDEATINAYGARVLELLEADLPLADGRDNGLELNPPALTIEPDATARWVNFYDHIERQCGPEGDLRIMLDFAAKTAENAARIAGVLAIVADPRATTVARGQMNNALDLMDWYVVEALRLREAARVSPKLAQAQQLLDWLRLRGGGEIAFREILRLGPNALRTKDSADNAVRTLVDHGWLIDLPDRPRRLKLVREG